MGCEFGALMLASWEVACKSAAWPVTTTNLIIYRWTIGRVRERPREFVLIFVQIHSELAKTGRGGPLGQRVFLGIESLEVP